MNKECTMKTITHILVLAALTFLPTMASSASSPDPLPNITGEPITNGFLFFDGKYIEPPYRVSSSNGAIYVNGLWGRGVGGWPPKDWSVDELPELPTNITEKSTLDDLARGTTIENGYLPQVMRYYHMRYQEKEATRRVIETVRALPFIATVKRGSGDSEDSVTVRTTNGDSFGMQVGVTGNEYYLRPPPKKESVIKKVERFRRKRAGILKGGGALFLFSNLDWKDMPGQQAEKHLPVLVDIATSSGTVKEKISELHDLRIMLIYDCPHWRSFVKNFEIPPAAKERVYQLGDPMERKAELKATLRREEEIRRLQNEAAERRRKEQNR